MEYVLNIKINTDFKYKQSNISLIHTAISISKVNLIFFFFFFGFIFYSGEKIPTLN